MTIRPRRNHTPAFKAKVALAAIKGDAELGIGFTTEFVSVKGVKVVGALPKEIEFVNEYSAYIPAASAAAEPARAFLAYLARPASRETMIDRTHDLADRPRPPA